MGSHIQQKAENALASVNAASGTARGLFTGFMALTAYLAIAFTSVTHLELLKYSPINLPIINVGVDIKSFYVFVPWLYLIIHANMLLVFSLITDKINQLEQTIQPLAHQQRQDFRNRIHVLIFAQYLSQQHSGFLKNIIGLIVWVSIGFFPLLLLLTAQLAFLPAQEEGVLWSQRLCIIIDAGLVCYFWSSILQKRRMALISKEWKLPQWRKYNLPTKTLFFISFLFVFFSIFIVTAPCGKWDANLGKCQITYPAISEYKYIQNQTFNFSGLYSFITNTIFDQQTPLLQRRLILRNQVITANTLDAESINEIFQSDYKTPIAKTILNKITGINLQNRIMRFSDFYNSHFPKVEFNNVNLQEADLIWANLQKARLRRANLQKAGLRRANLQKADLKEAKFESVTIENTKFVDAKNMPEELKVWLKECKKLFETTDKDECILGAN